MNHFFKQEIYYIMLSSVLFVNKTLRFCILFIFIVFMVSAAVATAVASMAIAVRVQRLLRHLLVYCGNKK